jgi:site-specific DNA recombinase
MLAELQPLGIGVVLVYDLDRAMRKLKYQLQLKDDLDALRVTLISLADGVIDTSTPEGILRFQAKGMVNEYQANTTARKVRDNLAYKARQGGWVGQWPIGYEKDDQGRLVPSDDAPTITLAFSLYASGNHSHTSLAEELNSRGHTIIDIHTGQRRAFGREGVRSILHNSAYIGMVQCSGVEYPGAHSPLLPLDLWERAKAVRERRTQQDGGRVFVRGVGGLLSEIAYCGNCGARMHWHISGRLRTPFYRCGRRAGYGKSACDAAMLNASQIEERTRQLLRLLVIPPHIRDAVLFEVQRRLNTSATPAAVDHERIKRQLARLKSAYLAGDEELSDEVYFRERDRLSRQLGTAIAPPPRQALDVQAAITLLSDMPTLLSAANHEEQRAILQQVFSRLWVEKPGIKAIAPAGTFTMLIEAIADSAVFGGCPTGFEPATS